MKRRTTLAWQLALALGLALPSQAAQDSAIPRQRRINAPGPQRIADGKEHAAGAGVPRGQGFGSACAAIGDLDGNGIADLAVGSPDSIGGGALWILFLNLDGSLLRSQRIGPGSGGFRGALPMGSRFGSALVGLGDLDHDGHLELAVGAPVSALSPDPKAAGAVWILSLDPKGLVRAQRQLQLHSIEPSNEPRDQFFQVIPLDAESDSVPVAERRPGPAALPTAMTTDGFGMSLAALGDLDGDGHADLVVGAPFDGDGGRARGAIWVLGLGARGELLSENKISDTEGLFAGTLGDGDRFGFALASAGDLDGDGRIELAVGAPGERGSNGHPLPSRGAVWILFLGMQGGVRRFARIEVPVQGDPPAGEEAALSFGSSLTSIGDFDADGTPDLAVGAPRAGARQQGIVWLLLLRPDGSVLAHQKLAEEDPSFDRALQRGAAFGTSMTLIDDLDGNGRADLMVCSNLDPQARAGDGALWAMLLESCFCASVSLREGSGQNARILSTSELPRRGNPWRISLDCSMDGHGVGMVLGRTRASSGIFTEAGEVLVDLSPSSFGFLLQSPHQGELLEFDLLIPADTASCNMALYVQGACSSGQRVRFSNALDLIIGR